MRRTGRILLTVALIAVLSGCGSTRPAVDVAAAGSATSKVSTQRAYRVPSGSMEPTLGIGARVIVSPGAPRVGAIVVFHPPEAAEREECGPSAHVIRLGGAACALPVPTPSTIDFVKRIVAGPGDEIYIREGHVYRKAAGSGSFVREPDQYMRPCGFSPACNFPTPIKISADHWYMLGDNRGESDDSRFYGAVPASWIVGTVTACAPRTAYRTTLEQLLGPRSCKLPGKQTNP
jgi:signal peptidase I